jgi:predicted transcriptional regulator
VQTLLHRLLEKGFLARRREGAAQVYEVAVTQDDLVVRQVQDLRAAWQRARPPR